MSHGLVNNDFHTDADGVIRIWPIKYGTVSPSLGPDMLPFAAG